MSLLGLFKKKKEADTGVIIKSAVENAFSYNEIPLQAEKRWKKLALVLPGGGARGAVEVGAIKVLWSHGIIPDVIIGTSVGAINGATIASGRTPSELEAIWLKLSEKMVFPMNYKIFWQFFNVKSTSGTINLKKVLNHSIKADYFEDCIIPIYVIATRLSDGEVAYFSKGPLREAVLASTAIPPYYPPYLIENVRYVDGSISSVAGVRKAIELGCDKVIIINAYNSKNMYDFKGIMDVTSHALDLLFYKNLWREVELCSNPFGNTEIMIIKIENLDIPTTDFSKTKELIRLGEDAALDALRKKGIIQ